MLLFPVGKSLLKKITNGVKISFHGAIINNPWQPLHSLCGIWMFEGGCFYQKEVSGSGMILQDISVG